MPADFANMNPLFSRCLPRAVRRALLALLPVCIGVSAQGLHDPLTTGPRGLTDVPPPAAAASAAATGAYGNAAVPSPLQRFPASAQPTTIPMVMSPTGPAAPTPTAPPALPLPPDPFTSLQPVVFGSQMFSGRFGTTGFSGFNADYQVSVGDRVSIRMWGAVTFDAVQPVDAQGNVFIPNVGPVKVAGARNGDINRLVEQQVKRTFRANVGVYASLEAAQPVKVYVTGFVRAPGLYSGLSSDSILAYLDRASGIDPDRGSFLEVDILRSGQSRAKINLYRFLLDGQIQPLQLQEGDAIVVQPRRHTVQVNGEVLNPYIFEFAQARIRATDLVALTRPRPSATHFSILRQMGADRRSEYHAVAEAADVVIQDGDVVTFTSDKYPGTILVRIDGANLGERSLVLPYGAMLKDAVARMHPAPQANVAALQLFRKSVAVRQKERLDVSLRSLETYALTARSSTSEEAALRTREADLILQFIERAKTVQPKGQVLLADRAQAGETLLEDGDVIQLPERSNLVLVSGEVVFPNALVWESGRDAAAYVTQAGGYTQDADKGRIVVLHQDGSVADPNGALLPGDEVLVLPRVQSKSIEVTRGITQILYQIAIAAKVAFGL